MDKNQPPISEHAVSATAKVQPAGMVEHAATTSAKVHPVVMSEHTATTTAKEHLAAEKVCTPEHKPATMKK